MGRTRMASCEQGRREMYIDGMDDEWEGHCRIVSGGEGQMNEID